MKCARLEQKKESITFLSLCQQMCGLKGRSFWRPEHCRKKREAWPLLKPGGLGVKEMAKGDKRQRRKIKNKIARLQKKGGKRKIFRIFFFSSLSVSISLSLSLGQ